MDQQIREDPTILTTKLDQIIVNIEGPQRDRFSSDTCLEGYLLFLRTSESQRRRAVRDNKKEPSPEEMYEIFALSVTEHGRDDVEPFKDLFEFVQIKVYSEAICENVGSVMNIANGTCRNLHPVNFAKEIYLRVNLPPLHTLKLTFIPFIVNVKLNEENKKYFRKLETTPWKN